MKNAAGYAVFDNMGVNLLLLSTARGSGLAVNNKTKQETFMKMVSVGGGLGMGVKDYDVVFVFGTEKALAQFLDSGWSGSGQADAAAKAGKKGGAYSGSYGSCPRSMGLPNHQKRSSPAVDPAGYEILQERRPQQNEWILAVSYEARFGASQTFAPKRTDLRAVNGSKGGT